MTDQTRESHAATDQLDSRERLQKMYAESPIDPADMMTNLGLYIRSSALVKLLVIDDLYRRIIDGPGAIIECGTWYGQNLVLFENLRAIYEPFNKSRRIIGFDTFTGYTGFSDKDDDGEIFKQGNYSTLAAYQDYLEELLEVHERCSVLGHIHGGHELVRGDITQSVPAYFEEHPEQSVALAYFDVGLYEPTKAALEAIKPNLLPGSVILLDEFNWRDAKGEALAFKEVFAGETFKIEQSRLTPLRAIVTWGVSR